MLCEVIKEFQNLEGVDLLELRCDLNPDLISLKYDKPLIFKCLENQNLDFSKASYIDFPHTTQLSHVANVKKNYPHVKIIISYHDFEKTPDDLDGIYAALQVFSADFYKIATFAEKTTDALRILEFRKKHSAPLIAIAMGEKGEISRICGKCFGNPWAYVGVSEPYTFEKMQIPYRYKDINSETALYGLIGEPVTRSPSHLLHNETFKKMGVNARYVKMAITKEELPLAFRLIKQLDFKGLSVTIPHKETIMELLDEIDREAKEIGAVNTVDFRKGKAIGYNTDVIGAMRALEEITTLQGKKMVILGAGGSARAIAYGALKKGCFVSLVNRDRERGQKLANEIGCDYGFYDSYDLLINTLPLQNGEATFDISGKDYQKMFDYQASAQFERWLSYLQRGSQFK